MPPAKAVATSNAAADLSQREASVTANLRIAHPHPWRGVDDPYLYRVVFTLRTKAARCWTA